MTSLLDLRPGDVGFGPIGGRAGRVVMWGELAVAPFDHWRTFRQWKGVRHCGVVTEAAAPDFAYGFNGSGGKYARSVGPKFGQAEPGGFEIIELGSEHWTSEWVYLRPNYQALATGPAAQPGQSQADCVAWLAQVMAVAHTPYGFEDYAAIAGHRAGIHLASLDEFIARVDQYGLPQRAICSQAVDAFLTLSGGLLDGKVFDDGRLAQDVTPSELYLRLEALGPAQVFRPGVS